MAIYLKIHYYFYTNWNFQRPMSCLILIWDPLKFYHFWTLQIKLSNFDRSSPSIKMGLYIIYPLNKEMGLPKLSSVKSMVILLKNSLLFLYKLKFSEAYVSLNIDLGSIKVSIIFALCRSNWATLTDLLPQPRWVFTLSIQLNKKWAYKAYFCEIYGHLLNNSLLFLYKLKFSEAYVSLNIDLGPIKFSFLDFADQTEQLWQILLPQRWIFTLSIQ